MLRILLVGVVLTTVCVPGMCAVTQRTDKCIEDDTSKSISSKDEKTVDNIMSMIQEKCTRDNMTMTVEHMHKDSMSILKSIKEYRQVVTMKQEMQKNIKWIVKESKGYGGVESFMRVIKRDLNDICNHPVDCSEVMKIKKHSGVYIIYPDRSRGSKGIEAYCDMETDGGGWTIDGLSDHTIALDNAYDFSPIMLKFEFSGCRLLLFPIRKLLKVIQKRTDGSVNFQRGWTEYENGFGKVNKEYWLGNKNIHILTSNGRYQLRVDLEDANGKNKYAIYNTFIVGGAASKYNLTVGGYSGNAGDGLLYHHGMKFSTIDQDNDVWSRNCAIDDDGGAWWHRDCRHSALNRKFVSKPYWLGVFKKSTMMIRKL